MILKQKIKQKLGNLKRKLEATPKDKLNHVFYGMVLYTLGAFFSPLIGLSIVVSFALLKEILDYFGAGNSEFLDFMYSVTFPVVLYIQSVM